MTSEYKLKELGLFLRSRRQRLAPEEVGLTAGPRRKTPGLRREEVAQLARLGVSWYSWLEQGRDIHVSAEALRSVATALRLTPDETAYIFEIAGHLVPPTVRDEPSGVSASLQRVLDSMTWTPAYVLNQRWDRIESNSAANALFGDIRDSAPRDTNVIWRLFTSPQIKTLVHNWESVAQDTLCEFYTTRSRCTDEEWMEEFASDLMQISPEFRAWWPKREIRPPRDRRTVFDHPTAGRLVLEFTTYYISERMDLRMCVLVPLPEEDSPRKLRDLIANFRMLPSDASR